MKIRVNPWPIFLMPANVLRILGLVALGLAAYGLSLFVIAADAPRLVGGIVVSSLLLPALYAWRLRRTPGGFAGLRLYFLLPPDALLPVLYVVPLFFLPFFLGRYAILTLGTPTTATVTQLEVVVLHDPELGETVHPTVDYVFEADDGRFTNQSTVPQPTYDQLAVGDPFPIRYLAAFPRLATADVPLILTTQLRYYVWHQLAFAAWLLAASLATRRRTRNLE